MSAEIYEKDGEKLCILGTRTALIWPFTATDWRDLRVGFFLSITDDTADDTITGLTESIAHPGVGNMPAEDRYWIGLKDSTTDFPRVVDVPFIGFSNTKTSELGDASGDSNLDSSDEAGGITNTNFWRPNGDDNTGDIAILHGTTAKVHRFGPNVLWPHFAQDETGAGGYATMLGLRLLRSSATSQSIAVEVKSGTFSCDMLHTNDPSGDILLSELGSWPTDIETLGPATMTTIPTAFFFYWPFFLSRLRIHAIALLKSR